MRTHIHPRAYINPPTHLHTYIHTHTHKYTHAIITLILYTHTYVHVHTHNVIRTHTHMPQGGHLAHVTDKCRKCNKTVWRWNYGTYTRSGQVRRSLQCEACAGTLKLTADTLGPEQVKPVKTVKRKRKVVMCVCVCVCRLIYRFLDARAMC